ncbi:MAG: prepilin-type N-terminal cleavage/methylation domain-containing protein [Rubrivivax sp.]|nr:prepilin-type N-terminal cleavage/methylation domain-containing protein [Rubrivivax sp.]MDP3225460.1 prepilin-type N-terminal cleavage/methylation domain-containing protein [Rubrivivax sp.]MDP3615577.1 prepilin-type N-terminal cleavage/methylation domain-containing protein [Rubrivivax sp.]
MNTFTPRPQRGLRQRLNRGVSLIEVLVVIVLFSFGLIGMVGLQARAVQFSVSAEDSSRAALLANEIVSAMWGANSINLSAAELTAWDTRVGDAANRGLPNGTGAVVVAGNVATVTITWRAPHEPATTVHRYVTQVQIP